MTARRSRAVHVLHPQAIWDKVRGRQYPDPTTWLENCATMLRETIRATEAAEMEARAKSTRSKSPPENPAPARAGYSEPVIPSSSLEVGYLVGKRSSWVQTLW